ncbi:MAG: right-handed parallel beta-helix repeat-containing protein [Planctomycetota bacterium]
MKNRSGKNVAAGLVFILILAAAGPAAAFTYRVSNGAQLERALSRAKPGDAIEVADGRYAVTVVFGRSGTAQRPIVLRAANDGEAIIDATGRDTALVHEGKTHIEIHGLVFENAANGPQAEQAMARPGSHWTLRRCIFQNATGAGLGLADVRHVRILGGAVRHNGQIGAGVSGSRDVLFRDTVFAHNNRGFDTEAEIDAARITEKVKHDGRWYTNPAWEGGGVKVSSSTNVVFEAVEAHNNHGPALWIDYACTNITLTGCHAHHNRSVNEGWQGMGIMVEYNADGPITVTNNRIQANEGVGLGIAESQAVLIEKNHLIDDELEFRDMDRPESSLGSVEVRRNTFERSAVTTSLGQWDRGSGQTKRLTIDENRWIGPVRYEWAGETFGDLDAVRAELGFETSSVVSERP